MKYDMKTVGAVACVSLLTACASFDHQDVSLLGGANEHNIAAQSVRDVNLPNSRDVESSSGVRAAKAVKALNEGKTQDLRQGSESQTGS